MAEIEQKGTFASSSLVLGSLLLEDGANLVSVLVSGICSCLSAHLRYCRTSELVLLSCSPLLPSPACGESVSDLAPLHPVLLVTQADPSPGPGTC